nr:hypothetical protein [Desulfobacula sp.]
MQKNTGGGAATNAGIDYQQRVAAWFLAMVFTRTGVSPLLGLPDGLDIESVAYENEACVDDLNIKCSNDFTLYLQIKRRICLSTSEQSDFWRSMDQFVRQFVIGRDSTELYILATSADSSGAIKRTLKKLTDSCRLNPRAFSENPLSKAERDVLSTYNSIIVALYKKHTSTDMMQAEFIHFTQRVYFCVLDVEEGGVHEVAAKTLMAPLLRVSPDLIWALLIRNSLHYAKSRFSVTSVVLKKLLNPYYVEESDRTHREAISDDDHWRLIAKGTSRFCTGKELVLVESFIPELDFIILEFFRFDANCIKRVAFTASEIIWGPDRTTTKVVCRMATEEGMRRYCEENAGFFKDKRLAILPAKGIEQVEETPCARLHAELCAKVFQDRKGIDKCLHCGKPLSQHLVTIVEVDDLETPPGVGGVHDECLRPVDRVLGRLQFPFFERLDFLRYFDVSKWAKLLVKGQCLFGNTEQARGKLGSVTIIGWNPENEEWQDFDYCVKVNLKDGNSRYLTTRGKLTRYPKQAAEAAAAKGNTVFADARAKNDPHCYTSLNWTYGQYSTLLSIKEEEEDCIECVSAEVVRYTEHIGREYATDVEFYTPLLYLTTGENQSLFILKDHLVFLTSPLDVERFLQNWREAGFSVNTYEIRIVESDLFFDKMVSEAFLSGGGVAVDPLLDRNGQLVKGYIVVDMETAEGMRSAESVT